MKHEADTRETARSRARNAWTVPLLAPLVVAGVLAGAAVVTVEKAGCNDPGRYVTTSQGVELVGGCLSPADLPVWPGHTDDQASRRG